MGMSSCQESMFSKVSEQIHKQIKFRDFHLALRRLPAHLSRSQHLQPVLTWFPFTHPTWQGRSFQETLFSGDSGDCRAFLTQCELHFELQVHLYSTGRSKIAYIISHLSAQAEAWATAEWSQRLAIGDTIQAFMRL